jgi:hypothetical protein
MVKFRKVFLLLAFMVALSGIVSAQSPVVKPQPNEKTYSVTELYLFKTYTRESYEKTFGVQPPPFDSTKPIKTWFDSTVTTPTVSYQTLDLNSLKNVTLVLKKEDAAAVNLPGAYRYSPYIVKPSECLSQSTSAPTPPAPVNPTYLSTRLEAEALASEVGGSVVLATDPGGSMESFLVSCPNTDNRNVWEVQFKTSRVLAGQLMLAKNAKGIGAPGFWDLSGPSPVWVSKEPVVTSSNYMRIPVRSLLPNEKYNQTPFGLFITRTDLDGPNGTGGFLLSDRAMLEEILKIVRELETKVK